MPPPPEADAHIDLRQVGANPNHWYPLALSRDLAPERMRATSFAGAPIVLVRGRQGTAYALEDRCAHRQMPLHLGRVCGNRVQCAYHGWTYGDTGAVTSIPYAPEGLAAVRGVRSYPCREAYGFIFVFPGDSARAQTVPLPVVALWQGGEYAPMYFSRRVNCHYSFMHENLMDMNHQFLHSGLMGRLRPASFSTRQGDTWIEAQYQFTGEGRMHRGAELLIGKRSDDPRRRDNVMTIRTELPYQTLEVCQRGAERPSFSMITAYVPVDAAQRVSHTLGMLLIRKPRIPGLLALMRPVIRYFAESVFAEDRRAVEAEQRAYDAQGTDGNQEVFPLILALRALLRRSSTATAPTRAMATAPISPPASATR